MEKYDDYKDSGVKQIGQIPRKWEVKKLKYLTSINQDSLPEHTDRESDIYYVDIGSVTMEAGINEVEHFKFGKAPSRARRLAKKGDTIISTVRTYLKAIGYVGSEEKKYVYSTGFAVLQPSKKIVPEYLYSFVKSDLFTNQVDTFSIGISYPAINSSTLGELYVAVPPKDTQATIATYLDQKTAQIDTAIAQKEQLIELLQERKQIIIQRAVTRGLDETVAMKDSGVDWIGKVPGHWEVVKNKQILAEQKRPGEEGLPILSVSIHSGVSSEELSDEDNIRGTIRIEDKTNYKLVEPTDITFNMMRAWQGGIGAVPVRGMVSPAYIVSQTSSCINADYFEYQYRLPIFIQQMDRNSKGITDFRKRLYWDEFKNLFTILPPVKEQEAIMKFLTDYSAKVQVVLDTQTLQIDKLREYRTVLIDAAVTGKINVS
jgi:type I restriction enzyme S subunit